MKGYGKKLNGENVKNNSYEKIFQMPIRKKS